MSNKKNIKKIIEKTLEDIKIKEINYIKKGRSVDEKYQIIDIYNKKYLLRLSPLNKYFRNKVLVKHQNKIRSENVSKVLKCGVTCTGENPYVLLNWLDGEDLKDEISNLDKETQYNLGVKSGKILKKIHSVNLEVDIDRHMWAKSYNNRLDRLIKEYNKILNKENSSIESYKKELDDKKLFEILETYKEKISNRTIQFTHGDYHIGNMLVDDKNNLNIIDFGSSSFSDPYEEFDRFVFNWSKSIEFANGQIHGYFDDIVPYEFFEMLLFYSCKNIISSLPLSIKYGQKELDLAIKNINLIRESYDNFNITVPNWYKEANLYKGEYEL